MFREKNRKGFTLVELIITITVLMLIMGVMVGLAVQMANAATDQQRAQAQHVQQTQARMALLNVVRDARMSFHEPPPTITANGFVFTSETRSGISVTITYTVEPHVAAAGDIYTGNFLLTRNVTGGPGFADIGEGEDQWPNPFAAVALQDINIDMTDFADNGRLGIDITLWVPLFSNDVVDPLDTAPDGFRTWELESRVAVRRRPTAP